MYVCFDTAALQRNLLIVVCELQQSECLLQLLMIDGFNLFAFCWLKPTAYTKPFQQHSTAENYDRKVELDLSDRLAF